MSQGTAILILNSWEMILHGTGLVLFKQCLIFSCGQMQEQFIYHYQSVHIFTLFVFFFFPLAFTSCIQRDANYYLKLKNKAFTCYILF